MTGTTCATPAISPTPEWHVLAPLFPPPATTGRHRAWPMRELINAMFFMLRGDIPWRMLPTHFPPHQTVYRWFTRFRDDGTWESLNHHLVMLDRERASRGASPTAAVIDTQSVKTTETGGPRDKSSFTPLDDPEKPNKATGDWIRLKRPQRVE